MQTAAAVADFRTYPLISALGGVQGLADRVVIEWADGRVSPFHHVWLRDNCPCDQCVYSVTREQVFESLAGFLANGVSILHKAYLVDVGEGVGNGVSQLVELVAADPHSTALYLRTSSFFTLRNISW